MLHPFLYPTSNIPTYYTVSVFRFVFEIYNSTSETWNTASKTNEKYLFLQRLTPLTSYKVRLKIWYTIFYTPFLWIPDGFEFLTLGKVMSVLLLMKTYH